MKRDAHTSRTRQGKPGFRHCAAGAKDAKAYANLATSRTTPTDPNAIAAAKAARLAGAEAILAKKNSATAATANTPEEKEAAASAAESHALEAKRQMNLAHDAYSKVK